MISKISPEPSCADPTDPSMISLAEALARIESRVLPVHACERLPIRECLDRVK
jgi:molybdopterin biosynthesis enzyme